MNISKFTEFWINSGGEPWDEFTDKFIIRVTVNNESGCIISTILEYKIEGYPDQEIQSSQCLFSLYAELMGGSNLIPIYVDDQWPPVSVNVELSKKEKEQLLMVLEEADRDGFFDKHKQN